MPNSKPITIRQVWSQNLESEFAIINNLIDNYPYISMDTEFPGVIFRSPKYYSYNNTQSHYTLLKSNVDALNLIQIGLTLSDKNGNLPGNTIWEFNFSDFNETCHPHNTESVELLKKQGTDFAKNITHGIKSEKFAELMMSSGLVCNENVTWVTFHSAYDFGYLVKILTKRALPGELGEFLDTLRVFFGSNIYDVKHLMKFCNSLYGGLDRVARALCVERVAGKCHQAGSDSLLTWHAFQKMRDTFFGNGGADKYAGVLYGLEVC